MIMAFDTPKFAYRVEQVGVSRQQAEAHAELGRDMIIADLATKADLASAVRELKSVIASAVRDVEQRVTIRLGAVAAQKLF
jgi:hypothetical protein